MLLINRYFGLKVKTDTDCWQNALDKLRDMISSIKNDLSLNDLHREMGVKNFLSHRNV